MKNKISQSLTEKDLDLLLNRSFADLDFSVPKNAAMLEEVSSWSFKGLFHTFTLGAILSKQVIILLSTLGLIGCVWYVVQMNEDNRSKQSSAPAKFIAAVAVADSSTEDAELVDKNLVSAPETYTNKPKIIATRTLEVVQSKNEMGVAPIDFNSQPSQSPVIIKETFEIHDRAPEEYIFPVLTEKEIRANEKEKKRIVKIVCRVGRDRRDDVARVPASQDGSIGPFYIGGGEVTNNEYRTFLFDLLIRGRKEDFLKAKPHQHLWKNVEGLSVYDTLAGIYFSDKKYNYFPVVNITHEGAEMYCRWLQQEVNAAKANDKNIPNIEIRLPTEKEWLYAASSGSADAVYSWPLPTIQNRANAFMANFCIQKLKEKFSQPIYYPKYNFNPAHYTSAGAVLNDKTVATIDVWSYNPNTFGLYGVCGNAAEMVNDDVTGEVRIKGGSWASDFEHLKITSKDEFTAANIPSPKIGFRICAFVK